MIAPNNLRPVRSTREALQQSALRLVERMLAEPDPMAEATGRA